MLDNLKNGLRAALKKIVNSSGIDEALIKELAKDVQRALLQSDVNVKFVFEITKNLEERSLKETPPPGLSRKDHIVKILYDELAKLLGTEKLYTFQPGKLNKVLLLGIQGSGKTTITAKLAKFLTKSGYQVAVIGADTFRPGALTQLKTLCEKTNVEVYGEEGNKDSPQVVKNGLKHFEASTFDVILIDTAGRHKEEKDLLEEMKQISKVANQDLTLLAKGGGALAAASATGAQIMYIGTGERIDDLEKFSPTRFVGRLLGMGDIQALLDMAKRLETEGDEERVKRITHGKMNMEDFYFQIEQATKAGGLRSILENMPGMSGMVKEDQLDQQQEKMEKWRYIIQSMTKLEKDDPDLLNASRIKRIARGSGWSEHEVKDLLKAYKNSKTMMKASKGRQMQGMLRKMGLG